MTAANLLLGCMVLVVGLVLAAGSRPVARLVLFGTAVIVSGLLFLPGDQITGFFGDTLVSEAERLARLSPWTPSDWTHFVLFFWLGLLVWLGRVDLRGWKAWTLILLLAVAAEALQALAPERSARWDDVLLNIAGGMTGLLLGLIITSLRSRAARTRSSH